MLHVCAFNLRYHFCEVHLDCLTYALTAPCSILGTRRSSLQQTAAHSHGYNKKHTRRHHIPVTDDAISLDFTHYSTTVYNLQLPWITLPEYIQMRAFQCRRHTNPCGYLYLRITGWTADCCLLTPDCSKPTAVAIQVSINVYMKVIEYTCTGVAQSTEMLWQT